MTHTIHTPQQHRTLLSRIAERAMLEKGLLPTFSAAVLAEVSTIQSRHGASASSVTQGLRNLTTLPWASIDNDDSRDLDQLTVAEALPADAVRVRVAVADVDALVTDGSAIDGHARHNTTSVYTAARIFPMLPEPLSTDLTSLNLDEKRLAVVVEFSVDADGSVLQSDVYRALVCNHAKLAYKSVAAWLDGSGPMPSAITAVSGLPENLRLQDQVAQRLKRHRHAHGALTLQTLQGRPVFEGERMSGIELERSNRATELIEDFMIAANGVTARYLADRQRASIRRVVRVPKRWDRIMALAQVHGVALPAEPSAMALDAFLAARLKSDPLRFPDVSLAVIKLLGSGEYVAEKPGSDAPGHFGLAVKDYTHSTAPNRRYPDLVTQRLLKAAISGVPSPYSYEDLEVMAAHLTTEEDAATSVERRVGKSAAAILLESRIGEQFDGLVTGVSDKGTWARLLALPAEGRIVRGFEGLDVSERVRVQLLSVNVDRGFIDFGRVAVSSHA